MPVLAGSVLGGTLIGLWVPVFANATLLAWMVVPVGGIAGWFLRSPGWVFVLALALASLDSHAYLERLLSPELSGRDVFVSGLVSDIPVSFADQQGQRFQFSVRSAPVKVRFPRSLRLSWYQTGEMAVPGECWQLLVRLKSPHGFANRAGFDRLRHLFVSDVGAVGYIRASALNRRCSNQPWQYPGLKTRARVADRIRQVLGGEQSLPLILGITVGLRNQITPAQWQLFRDSGTTHLMAISGLHIGMVAAASWILVALLTKCLVLAGIGGNVRRAAAPVAALAAALYACAAGFALPTSRALLMLLIALLLSHWQRHWQTLTVISAALLAIVLYDTRSVLTAGFWLSFAAVLLLSTCAKSRSRKEDRGMMTALTCAAVELVRAQWVLGVGLALLVLLFFEQISLVAPLANLIAIPLFSLLVMPLTFSGCLLLWFWPTAGSGLLALACDVLDLLLSWLAAMTGNFPSAWSPGSLSTGQWLLLILAAVALLLPRPLPRLRTGLALLVLGVFLHRGQPPPGLRLHVLDVGQGLAVLLQVGDQVLLYDTGPAWRAGGAGQQIVVPVLRKLGIAALDTVIVSHGDSDHSGGLQAVLDAVSVDRLFSSGPLKTTFRRTNICQAGQSWRWGATRFEFLHPQNRGGWSDNNASCVLLIEHGANRILLPGDIERAAERVLTARYQLTDINLMIAPHHGSRTSSGRDFARLTSPRYIVFSTGYVNRWGFPHPEVVQRWRAQGACAINTATSGAVEFAINLHGVLEPDRIARSHWSQPWALRRPSPC